MVRSRIFIGIGAWLLGAVSATAGSLYAVDQLGQSLLEQHPKEISVAIVNAQLAQETSRGASPVATASPSPTAAPIRTHSRRTPKPVRTSGTARPVGRDAGKLLTSTGGTAAATCDDGLARLLYWSPGQGFAVSRVHQGPSPVASVTFTNSSGGVIMQVRCRSSGVPYGHVVDIGRGSGSSRRHG